MNQSVILNWHVFRLSICGPVGLLNTLAGAAEEILGKLLNKEGKEHWLDRFQKVRCEH